MLEKNGKKTIDLIQEGGAKKDSKKDSRKDYRKDKKDIKSNLERNKLDSKKSLNI